MACLLDVAGPAFELVGTGPRDLAELVALDLGPDFDLDFVAQLGQLGLELVVAVDVRQLIELVGYFVSAADSFGPAVLDFLLVLDPAKPFVVRTYVVDAAKVSKTRMILRARCYRKATYYLLSMLLSLLLSLLLLEGVLRQLARMRINSYTRYPREMNAYLCLLLRLLKMLR